MKTIVQFLLVVFSIVVFPMLLSAQVINPPQMINDLGGSDGHVSSFFQYIYSPNGSLIGLGFGTYKKNIGGDGIVTTHITIGNFAQNAQFTVKHNYRYVLVAYYHIQTIYLDSVYTIYETFPGTISDTLIYRVIQAFNPFAGPPFYHFYTANIPTRMDSVTLTCWDSTSTGIENTFTNLPTEFILRQNYPNPFNPSTCISFNIPTKSFVSLRIFDLIGREVATLVSEEMSAGSYSKQFNANTLPSGVYFYRLQAGLFTETKKLILLR